MSHGAANLRLPFGASILQREYAGGVSAMAALYAPAVSAITLGAFALRLALLDRFPFREDEASYAYWALHGWLEDPLFLQVWPDKPPLYLWFLGGAFRLFGVSEASARWVNVAASTLLVPVVAATARTFWGRRAALAAAAVLALSPYAISFGPTAFTDPVLVLAGMAAFCAALNGRAAVAGLLLGAAVMTKQQGVLYIPLVAGGALLAASSVRPRARQLLQNILLLAAGTSLVVLPIVYWDSLRWAVAPSPWDLSVRNYGALALLPPVNWPARVAEWGPLLWELTASWAVWNALVILAVGGVVARLAARGLRSDRSILLVGVWSLLFLAAHLVSTVQPWDRYMLPLAPMLALGAGWSAGALSRILSGMPLASLGLAAMLILISPAQQAASGRLAAGGDHGDYAGLPEAIRAVDEANEDRYILYHRSLGAHFRFYLYGRTGDTPQADAVDLRWFPNPVYLADNAAKMPYPRKFLIEPAWAPVRDLEPHLAMRDLVLEEVGRYGRFTVWEIGRRPSSPCDWCLVATPAPWRVRGAALDDVITLR